MVMLATPVWPDAGVTVTVRLLLLPPKTMFATGTRVVLPELPESVRFPAGVVALPIVKGIAGVAVSTAINRLAMLEMVGGWSA
jgi:hypothetical protein